MRKRHNAVISVLLSFIMIVSMIPTPVLASMVDSASGGFDVTPVGESVVEKGSKDTEEPLSGEDVSAVVPGDDAGNVVVDVNADLVGTDVERVRVRFVGTDDQKMDDLELALDGTEQALPECTFVRDGHKFVGWSTTVDGKPVSDDASTEDVDESMQAMSVPDRQALVDMRFAESDDKVVDLGPCVREGTLVLYAQWRERVTLAFDANGGQGEMTAMDVVADGKDATLPSCPFVREGHSFGGWSVDGTDLTFADGAKIADGDVRKLAGQAVDGRVTLRAEWKAEASRHEDEHAVVDESGEGSDGNVKVGVVVDGPVDVTVDARGDTGSDDSADSESDGDEQTEDVTGKASGVDEGTGAGNGKDVSGDEGGTYAHRLIVRPRSSIDVRPTDKVLGRNGDVLLLGFETKSDMDEARTWYEPRCDLVAEDIVFDMSDGDGDAAQVTMDERDNPFAALGAAEDVPALARLDVTVALLDTGAPNGVVSSASMVSDDGVDRNGHAARMLEAMREQNADVRVMSVKVLDDEGHGTASSVYAGVVYAVDNGADVINMSFAGPDNEGNAAIAEAVRYALDHDVVVIAAAGNGGHDAGLVTPANVEGVFTVGAADDEGNVRESSNRGACVDVYVRASSTFVAAAQVSGCVSLGLAGWRERVVERLGVDVGAVDDGVGDVDGDGVEGAGDKDADSGKAEGKDAGKDGDKSSFDVTDGNGVNPDKDAEQKPADGSAEASDAGKTDDTASDVPEDEGIVSEITTPVSLVTDPTEDVVDLADVVEEGEEVPEEATVTRVTLVSNRDGDSETKVVTLAGDHPFLPDCPFEWAHHQFVGWFANRSDNKISGIATEEIPAGSDLTFYAAWAETMPDRSVIEGLDFSSRRLVVGSSTKPSLGTVVSSGDDAWVIEFKTKAEAAWGYADLLGKVDFVAPDVTIGVASADDLRADLDGSSDSVAALSGSVETPEPSGPVATFDVDAPRVTSGRVVALIDTGVSASVGIDGRSSVIGDVLVDDNGHGTDMAEAMRLVDPDVRIWSIKAADASGVATASSLYAAIEAAIEMRVSVISVSFSALATNGNAAVEEAIRDAHAAGIMVVGAAGNNGNDAKWYIPGRMGDEAVIVGASDEEGTRRSFSNYGDTVDVYVPSDSTSVAAAKVAGWLANHGEFGHEVESLSSEEARSALGLYVAGEADESRPAEEVIPSPEDSDGDFYSAWTDIQVRIATHYQRVGTWWDDGDNQYCYKTGSWHWANANGATTEGGMHSVGRAFDVAPLGGRLEGFGAYASNWGSTSGDVVYEIFKQTIGATGSARNGTMLGSTGDGKRCESIRLRFEGNASVGYGWGLRVVQYANENTGAIRRDITNTDGGWCGERGVNGRIVELWVRAFRHGWGQTLQVRYQDANGAYGSYSKVIDDVTYFAGAIVYWSVDNATYKASTSWTAWGAASKTLNVPRKTASNTVRYRFQNENGGWGDWTSTSKTLRVGESWTWSRAQDATYSAASVTITGTQSAQTKDVNIYRRTWAVRFNGNGHTGGSMSNERFYVGQTKALTSNAFTAPSGYTFAGWATSQENATAGTVAYADQADMTAGAPTDGDTVTLYAVWERDITFYHGQNKAQSTVVTQYWDGANNTGADIIAPSASVCTDIAGWTELGWRDDGTAGIKEVDFDASFDPTATEYYAVYLSTITFYNGYNGATQSTATGYYNSNDTSRVTAPAIVNLTYWTARGWRTDTTAADYVYAGTDATTITDFGTARVLYAVYSQMPVMGYVGNGSTGGSTVSTDGTVRYLNSGSTALSDSNVTWTLADNGFTKSGYTFSGWDLGNAGASYSVAVAYNANPHRNARAQWSGNTYTIVYAGMDAATHGASHPTSGTYDSTLTISNPIRGGYVFDGWDITGMDTVTHTIGSATTSATSVSGTKETSFRNLRSTAGTVTFTARWTAHEFGGTFIDQDNVDSDGDGYGDNIAFSVATSVNYVVKADGSLVGPSDLSIQNHGSFDMRVSSLDIDAVNPFSVVRSAGNQGNAVDFVFGPSGNTIEAVDYLSKANVPDVSAWHVPAQSGSVPGSLQLVSSGHVGPLSVDAWSDDVVFARMKWYVMPVE